MSKYDFDRNDQFKAAELECIDQMKTMKSKGFNKLTYAQKEDGVYINDKGIEDWSGPMKMAWISCMKPQIVEQMEKKSVDLAIVREKACVKHLNFIEGDSGAVFTYSKDGV